MVHDPPKVLVPFIPKEAARVKEIAAKYGVSDGTVRGWASLHDLGRLIGGRWYLSWVAVAMHWDGNRAALRAYWSGDRESRLVVSYYERLGIAIPANLRGQA